MTVKIWTTSSPHGILDHSYPTAAATDEACRVAHFKGRLYCVYIDGVRELDGVKVISRVSNASLWSAPATVSDTPAKGAPCIFVFKDQLHVIYATSLGTTNLLTLDEASGLFVFNRALDFAVDQTPSLAVVDGRLLMFHHVPDNAVNIWYRSTLDLQAWSRGETVKTDGTNSLRSNLSPLAITYQRLIHLVYKDAAGGFYLLRYDGSRQWSRAQLLLDEDYDHSPAGAVHNGLLKLLFTRAGEIHQYGHDGNLLGPATLSTNLGATHSPGAAVQDGVLNVLYRGMP